MTIDHGLDRLIGIWEPHPRIIQRSDRPWGTTVVIGRRGVRSEIAVVDHEADDARRQRTRMDDALAAVGRDGDEDGGLDALAQLAAEGHAPAESALLGQILRDRLAETTVRSVLLDQADIDDAVQNTLIAVSKNIASFEGRSKFTTWLYRVARNEALMVIRRKGRAEPSGELPDASITARYLSSLIANQETVQAALEQLSPDHREVLRLREDLQLSYDEISDRLGIPINTVRSRLKRARQALLNLLVGRDDLDRGPAGRDPGDVDG